MRDNKGNERDGVIYTPSASAGDTINYTVKKRPAAKKRAPVKSQYKTLMLVTIISGFVICIVVFAVVFNAFRGRSGTEPPAGSDGPDLGQTLPVIEKKSEVEFLGVLKNVDAQLKRIDVLDIGNQKEYALTITGTTELKNKYGQSVTLPEFEPGDIVAISFNNIDREIKALKESAEGFEYKSVTRLSLDPVQKTVRRNNDVYVFDRDLIVTHRGKPYDIMDIQEIDVATIKGYKDTVWSIEIEKSHGYIKIVNKDKVVNGTIDLGHAGFKQLSDVDEVTVSEGVHKISVDGDNVEPYIKEVVVSALETSLLDLSLIQEKSSVVVFKVNEDDYELKINGVIELSREPVILNYGVYDISVGKENFVDWTEKININAPQMEIPVELKKVVNMGKLTVNSVPQGADLYVDNAYIGVTPVTKDVVQGDHVIILKKEGFKELTMGVVVGSDSIPYNITLQRTDETFGAQHDQGSPVVTASPTGAPVQNPGYIPFESLPPSTPSSGYEMNLPFQTPE